MSDTEQDRINERRWQQFQENDGFEQAKTMVQLVINAAGLNPKDIGETWGITVHVDNNTYLRLNVGDYALFDIRDPKLDAEQREVCIAVLNPGSPRIVTRLIWACTGTTPAVQAGFTRYVPGSECLLTTSSKAERLLRSQNIQSAMRRHVAARPRKLFSQNRHNPHTNQLVA